LSETFSTGSTRARSERLVIAEIESITTESEIDGEIANLHRTLQAVGPLRIEFDRGFIAGASAQIDESVAAADESGSAEMALLLGVCGTADLNWEPADWAELLRHFLRRPLLEYLGTRTTRGANEQFDADTPSEKDAVSMPLRELFRVAAPPLGLLIATKRHARHLLNHGRSVPHEVHRSIYFAKNSMSAV